MIRLRNIQMPLDMNEEMLYSTVAKKLKIQRHEILSVKIRRRSVDARKKPKIYFLFTLDVGVRFQARTLARCKKNPHIFLAKDLPYTVNQISSDVRPIIVGAGPAGLFAAYVLALANLRPIVLERGCDVDTRIRMVDKFRTNGTLDTECNVQFGEGGAGTFSDGKLHTGIRDTRIAFVLKTLADCGAPNDILWQAKPHIGTDLLVDTIRNLREKIINLGGEFRFGHKLMDLRCSNGSVESIVVATKVTEYELLSRYLVLALGHSARDTVEMLYESGVKIEQKDFAMGVRIEHLQTEISKSLYGDAYLHPNLSPADYHLSVHLPNGRVLYTFCMCPGGEVIAASSETNKLCINGMSKRARNGLNANSALLVNITTQDFPDTHPLAGIAMQRKLEQKAFHVGNNYFAPVIRVGDFLENKESTYFGKVRPSYKPGTLFCSPDNYLPEFMCDTLRQGILHMDKKLNGFANSDAILTGVETRSSAPYRILRDKHTECVTCKGIYPCGEGAGYAGGITSAAVDGMYCAENIIQSIQRGQIQC